MFELSVTPVTSTTASGEISGFARATLRVTSWASSPCLRSASKSGAIHIWWLTCSRTTRPSAWSFLGYDECDARVLRDTPRGNELEEPADFDAQPGGVLGVQRRQNWGATWIWMIIAAGLLVAMFTADGRRIIGERTFGCVNKYWAARVSFLFVPKRP